MCGTACVDTQTDPAHCGDCDDPCSDVNASAACVAGECVLTCDMGFDNCDMDIGSGCEQPLNTAAHCGACDVAEEPEVCDGVANDCNDATPVDAGCPLSVTLEGGTFIGHDVFGNTAGGVAFEDTCPGTSALVGFSGDVGGNIDRIRGACADLSLVANTGVTPYTYSIATGVATILPTHGGNITTQYSVNCAANEVVVGVTGEASSGGLHDVTIHCAELLITGSPGSFAVSYGAITTMTVDGSNAGTSYSDLLAAPAAVDRYRGRAGAWVDAIGIGEAEVTLNFIE